MLFFHLFAYCIPFDSSLFPHPLSQHHYINDAFSTVEALLFVGKRTFKLLCKLCSWNSLSLSPQSAEVSFIFLCAPNFKDFASVLTIALPKPSSQ